MRLKNRFRLIAGVAAVGLLTLSGCWLYTERSLLIAQKREQAKNLVAIPYSILSQAHQLQIEGRLSASEAQRQAIQAIQAIRYDGENYFWINDLRPTMIMHPINPRLNGQDLSQYKDPSGKAVFREIVATVKKDGRGFVSYRWPKPGSTSAAAKLSYVQEFEPWAWVIGTGIYIDDIDATWRTNAVVAAALGLACFGILMAVTASVSRSIFDRLDHLVRRITKITICQEDLTEAVRTTPNDIIAAAATDEVGHLMGGFNEMMTHIRLRDLELRKHREHLEDEVAKRTEQLSTAHAEIALFLECIPSILIGLDLNGRITRWNRTASQTFGLCEQEAKGRSLDQCGIKWLHPDIGKEVSQWLRIDMIHRFDDLAYEKDGKVRFVGFSARPILSDQHERTGLIVTGMETTERKILEEQLRQAQKLEAIGQLSAGISHEINTPTQFIGDNTLFLKVSWEQVLELVQVCRTLQQEAAFKGSVSTELLATFADLCERCDLSYLVEEVPHAIDQSLDGLQRVAKIVRAMKEFSHQDAEYKQAADINQGIDATLTVAHSEWTGVAEIETHFDPDLPLVPCYLAELNQVILNLVLNSTYAISEVVGDGSRGKGKITVSTRRDGEWVEIVVSDTGPGIPNDIRTRVFEPFFSTKPVGKGTGQGLALAHSVVVRKHGGQIWFDTEPGRGTTFFLRIPYAEELEPAV